MSTSTIYTQAIELVVNQQLFIEAVVGIPPSCRVMGNVTAYNLPVVINNAAPNQTKINYRTENITPVRVSSQAGYTGPTVGNTYSYGNPISVGATPPAFGLGNFQKNVALGYGGLTFTVTNFSSQLYPTPGQYTWLVPDGVTSVNIAAVGGGGGGTQNVTGGSGGGGGFVNYQNAVPVTPGDSYLVLVGGGGAPGYYEARPGSSTYVVSSGGTPIVHAGPGAGAGNMYWNDPEIFLVGEDITGLFSSQAATNSLNNTTEYSIVNSSLPSGMTLNTATGDLFWTESALATTGDTNTITYYPTFNLTATAGSQSIGKNITVGISSNPIDPFYSATNLIVSFENNGTLFSKDVSTYKRQTIVSGNVIPTTYSPFNSNYYSAFFDGGASYLTVSTATNLELAASSFTVEFWWCPISTTRQWFIHATTDYWFGIDYNCLGTFRMGLWASSNGTTWNLINADAAGNGIGTSAAYPRLGQWNHVAVSRIGGTWAMWLNGIQVLQLTGITAAIVNRSTQAKVIGSWAGGTQFRVFGWLSAFKVQIGGVTYNPFSTGNISAPTAPVTAPGAGLLILQSNTFNNQVLGSTGTVTVTGNVSIVPYHPYGETPVELVTTSTFNSGYFAAANDFMLVPQEPTPLFGTGDFTLEAWVYPTSRVSSVPTIFSNTVSSGYRGSFYLIAGHTAATTKWSVILDGGIAPNPREPQMISESNIVYNQWSHVAVTRIGNTTTLYVNGLVEGYISTSTPYSQLVGGTGPYAAIGCSLDRPDLTYFNGYISNLRTVADTGVYNIPLYPPSTYFNGANYVNLTTASNFPPAVSNTAYTFGNGNFTVEFWVNFQQTNIASTGIIGSQDFNWIAIELNTTTADGRMTVFLGGPTNATPWSLQRKGNTLFEANRWYHCAYVRSSGTLSHYVNGVLDFSVANSTVIGAPLGTLGGIGIGRSQLVNRLMRGWISNLRIVRGAVYTGNFTMPSAPLQPTQNSGINIVALAGTDTCLLTCQDTWFRDNSTVDNQKFGSIGLPMPTFSSNNPFVPNTLAFTLPSVLSATQEAGTYINAITATTSTTLLTLQNYAPVNNAAFVDNSIYRNTIIRSGTPTQGSFNPYRQLSSSTYFNGASFVNTATASPVFGLGTDDFTIECWVLPTSNPGNGPGTIYDLRVADGASATTLRIDNARRVLFYNGPSNVNVEFTGILITMGVWSHIAVVRVAGVVTGYINGKFAGSGVVTSNLGTTQPCLIGVNRSAGYNWNGYISNFRIVKGFSLYRSEFTPPSSPLSTTQPAGPGILELTTASAVSILTLHNGYLDSSNYNHFLVTSGSTTMDWLSPFAIPSSYQPYNSNEGGSGYFGGASTDFLQIQNNPGVTLASSTTTASTSSWTVECWAKPSGDYGIPRAIWAKRVSGGTTTSYQGYLRGSSGVVSYYNGTELFSTFTPQAGVWTHLAWVYDGVNLRIYANGILRYTTALASVTDVNHPVTIGGLRGLSEGFQGWISDLRMVRGIAVYTSPTANLGTTVFEPPTSMLQRTQSARTNVAAIPSNTFTTVLINFNNAAIYDLTTKNTLLAVGNAQVTDLDSRYSGESLLYPHFPAITSSVPADYIRTPPPGNAGTPGTSILPGDFTVEYWFKANGFKNPPRGRARREPPLSTVDDTKCAERWPCVLDQRRRTRTRGAIDGTNRVVRTFEDAKGKNVSNTHGASDLSPRMHHEIPRSHSACRCLGRSDFVTISVSFLNSLC